MKPRATTAERESIIQLHKQGYNGREISEHLGGIPISTVNANIKRFKETNSVLDRKIQRKDTKVSSPVKRMIKDACEGNRYILGYFV